jgi:hypothetical protein
MVIEWDVIIVEMSILAGIIYFSVYLEHWTYNRSQKKEDEKIKQNITRFIENDLQQRLNFINESLQYRDYKPFFTDMWDAVILAGEHSLLSFELFQSHKDRILGCNTIIVNWKALEEIILMRRC